MNLFDLMPRILRIFSVAELRQMLPEKSWTTERIKGGQAGRAILLRDELTGSGVDLLGLEADTPGSICEIQEHNQTLGQSFVLLRATPGTFVSNGHGALSGELNLSGELFLHPPNALRAFSVGNKNGQIAFAVFIAFRGARITNRLS